MRLISVLALAASLLAGPSQEYSMGAPDSACRRMEPGHGFSPQVGSSPPARLVLEKTAVAPGEALPLKVEGGTFKGFMVQARNAADPESQVGSFETEQASYMTCGKGIHNSITHSSPVDKTLVEAVWKAPEDFEGEVLFRYSILGSYDKYWVRIDGDLVRVARSADLEEVPEVSEGSDDDEEIVFPGQETTIAEAADTTTTATTKSTTASSTPGITFSTSTTTTSALVLPTSSAYVGADHPVFDGCGQTKTCFGMPAGCLEAGGCTAVTAYDFQGGKWRFQIVGRTDGYISVGLSDNDRMGDDLTSTCIVNAASGDVDILSGFNNGYSNEILSPAKLGIENFEGSYEDGVLSCSYRRPTVVEVAKFGQTFNLEKDKYFVFLAEGAFRSGYMQKHRTKTKSAEPQNLGTPTTLAAGKNFYVKLHGSFMVGAWILSASCGIFLARYFKQTWTNAKCGKIDQWFIWHRSFMMLTWGLTMAGFILIFLELRGWTKISIKENPHALLGVVCTGLCFMQPLIALLRCHPDHKQRSIFNWVHWFVGNAAQIVGIVAIFFAVELDKAELPKPETDYLLIAFVAFHFLMHLVLSLLMCSSDMKKDKLGYSSYPMRNMNGAKGMYPDYEELKRDAPGGGVRKFFLVVYLLGNVVMTAALILLIVFAPVRPILERAGILGPESS